MRSKSILLVAVLALTLWAAGQAFAHCGKCGVGDAKGAAHESAAGVKTCLCGMALEGENLVSVEHEGTTYQFCSLECANMFKDNPEAVLEKMSHGK